MNETALQHVRELAADILGVSPGSLTAATGPETLPQWDSVQQLNLVLAMEQHYGWVFDPEEIDGMKNIGAIAAIVERKRGSTV